MMTIPGDRKTVSCLLAVVAMLMLSSLAGATVVLNITATNPSATEAQEIEVQSHLPKGVEPKHVLKTDGMDLIYDEQREQYMLTSKIELQPQESKTFHVEIEDIWLIDDAGLAELAQRAEEFAAKLVGRKYEKQARELRDRITANVGTIRERQAANRVPAASPLEHISTYHRNKLLFNMAKEELAALDELLAISSGDGIGNGGGGPRQGVPPSLGTIWKVIFFIISFIGAMSILFFFIWSRQLRKVRQAEQLREA